MNENIKERAAIIKEAYQYAEAQQDLPDEVYKIHGMSSPKSRTFFNRLAGNIGGRYMEVGSWKGSTLISAGYGNQEKIDELISIENFSQPHGSHQFKSEFFSNIEKFQHQLPKTTILDKSCWTVDPKEIGPVDIYFYDGDHSTESQAMAFTHFKPCITPNTIVIVDDWEFRGGTTIQPGTYQGLEKAGLRIRYSKIIPSGDDWWFGFGIFILATEGQVKEAIK